MSNNCSRCECSTTPGNCVAPWQLRMPEETTVRWYALCEECYPLYESYVVHNEHDDDEEEELVDDEPQDTECEDDPCAVLHTAIACDDCSENPM